MHRIVDSFTDPADHLAMDEAALLDGSPAIRLWEFQHPTVIAGRSSRVDDEINRDCCDSLGIPILRRCTGGASVVGGPGCLMYSIVLDLFSEPALKRINVAHRYVMARVLDAARQQLPTLVRQGICDLTWDNRKVSGNSLRVTRDSLLYHGTILYDFDLGLISQCLKIAPRQPEYRQGRDHDSFVTNVPIDPGRFASDLCSQFDSESEQSANRWLAPIRELRSQRYDDPRWHFRH